MRDGEMSQRGGSGDTGPVWHPVLFHRSVRPRSQRAQLAQPIAFSHKTSSRAELARTIEGFAAEVEPARPRKTAKRLVSGQARSRPHEAEFAAVDDLAPVHHAGVGATTHSGADVPVSCPS